MAEEEGEEREFQQQLERAVCSRLQHFKDQADSLTLESVRRLLEKDLGLDKFALDAHKRFIRQYLEKQMEDADDCKSEKPKTENVDKDVSLSKEATILPEQKETSNDPKKSSAGEEELTEDSPIMGVLTPKSEAGTQGSAVSKIHIEKAILERADYFLANSENITLAGVRRLLEEDLGLVKNALDPFKKLISQRIDQVFNSPKGAKSTKDVGKKKSDPSRVKKSEKITNEEESDSSDSESSDLENKVKSRKETARRRTTNKLGDPKKRKISKEIDLDSGQKQNKLGKRQKREDNDPGDDGSISEDGHSQSSVEKSTQRKENSAPGYGNKVEKLKSIIKACGMSVAPSVYKKAKQVPEDRREAFLLKELEEILSREGLSKNPSEKEIKDCRKSKETARELEGIDMSNIISSSRRRSTFSFVTPPKPEIGAKNKKVAAKDSKRRDNNKEDHGDEIDEEEKKEEVTEDEEAKNEKPKEDEDAEEEEEEEAEEDEDDEEQEDEDDESDEFDEDDNEESE